MIFEYNPTGTIKFNWKRIPDHTKKFQFDDCLQNSRNDDIDLKRNRCGSTDKQP